jgi:hypothetical protein
MEKNQKMKRCCKNCQHFNPKTMDCYEGGYSEIGNPERELSSEDCNAFIPKCEGDDSKILFLISEEDAQIEAQRILGRRLTDEELYRVKKGLEFGLECWAEVLIEAIKEATSKR